MIALMMKSFINLEFSGSSKLADFVLHLCVKDVKDSFSKEIIDVL